MAFLGGDVVSVKVTTTSSTGSFRDITQQVQEFSGLNLEAILEEIHSLGDGYRETAFSGLRQINEITMSGPWDNDTSTGTQGIFGNATDVGAERVVKLNLGTTNAYPKFDVIVRSYEHMTPRGALQRYSLTVVPTGALTIATT